MGGQKATALQMHPHPKTETDEPDCNQHVWIPCFCETLSQLFTHCQISLYLVEKLC